MDICQQSDGIGENFPDPLMDICRPYGDLLDNHLGKRLAHDRVAVHR